MLAKRDGNPGDPMADDAIDSACRHPRIAASSHMRNVSSVRCCDCGHSWMEVHPPRTAMMAMLVQSPPLPDQRQPGRLGSW
jgi:hypothetical protein